MGWRQEHEAELHARRPRQGTSYHQLPSATTTPAVASCGSILQILQLPRHNPNAAGD